MKSSVSQEIVPTASEACLYGLMGEVARAGSDGTEANPYAIAANFMAYLSCAVGCGPYLPVGNTWHHPRLFTLHVGRSGRGRKGDALSLVLRLDAAVRKLDEPFAPQLHRGGLSTREGLVALIHDGYRQGRHEMPPVEDKRLWVVESEFANILHQGKREGNTLSAALRDCWDGVCLKPATKTNRMYASNPHVCLSGAITPGELAGMLSARDLTNGFANRFLMIWAERQQVLPFPQATPQSVMDALTLRILEVLQFVRADQHQRRNHMRMELTELAQQRYAQIYQHELDEDCREERLASLKERHAPMLLRMAMLFALTDLQSCIDLCHIDAAMAWIRYADASAKYVFGGAGKQGKAVKKTDHAARIVEFLRQRGCATRREITMECFRGHASKAQIDAAIGGLLNAGIPPLGYDVENRRLVPNAKEATLVRHIFKRFVEIGSTTLLVKEMRLDGATSKAWVTQDGKVRTGKPIDKSLLYKVLNNRTYLGELRHKDEWYRAEHPPIIDQQLWDDVQAILSVNGRQRAKTTRVTKVPFLLKGIVFGSDGYALSPWHSTNRRGRSYRYYIPQRDTKEFAGASGLPRLPAAQLEGAVLDQLRGIMRNPSMIGEIVPQVKNLDAEVDEAQITVIMTRLNLVWDQLFPAEQSRIVRLLVEKVVVSPTNIELRLHANGIGQIIREMQPTAATEEAMV